MHMSWEKDGGRKTENTHRGNNLPGVYLSLLFMPAVCILLPKTQKHKQSTVSEYKVQISRDPYDKSQ